MDLIRAIQRDNREWVGKFYLKKAVSFALEEKFTLSYEYFKEGLNLLTCDCDDGWLAEYKGSNKDLFESDVVEYGSVLPYLFVKAYILSFEESDEDLKQALSLIDVNIEKKPEELAYYIKGRILSRLDDHEKALNVYLLARKFKKTARVEYRIGRTCKELGNGYEGYYLSDSLFMNMSSACCARELKDTDLNVELNIFHQEDLKNPLINYFQPGQDSGLFSALYKAFQEVYHFKLTSGEEIRTVDALEEFEDKCFRSLYVGYDIDPLDDDTDQYSINFYSEYENNLEYQFSKVLSKLEEDQFELFDQNNFHTEAENIERTSLEGVVLELEKVEHEMYWADDYDLYDDDDPYDESYNSYDDDGYMSAYDNPYYNDNLDMDQQSPDFWDSF